MKRRPDELIQVLATRIRQTAATCDFGSITDPLNEVLRTCFICSINNEAVLKAPFKLNVDELTFTRAIEVAAKTNDAAKVAKETVFGSILERVQKVKRFCKLTRKLHLLLKIKVNVIVAEKPDFKNATCNYYKLQGHLKSVCRKGKAKHQ